MSILSFKKILKGIDKTLDVTGGATKYLGKGAIQSGVGLGKTGLDIAKKVKNVAFEEMSEEALSESTNILEHLTGLKAKKGANMVAFGAMVGYSAFNISDDIQKRKQMGTIVGADIQPNMINSNINPILDQRLQEYESSETYRNSLDEELNSQFGSATPDIVFALHELRNRG